MCLLCTRGVCGFASMGIWFVVLCFLVLDPVLIVGYIVDMSMWVLRLLFLPAHAAGCD